MNRELAMASTVSLALRAVSFAMLASVVLCACSSDSGQSGASAGSGTGGSPAAAGGESGAAMQSGGVAGALASEGGAAAGGAQSGASAGAGALSGSGGALNNAGGTSAGVSGSAGTSAGGSANMAGANSNGGAAGGPPSNCDLPTPVSFQKNIQSFLTTSCGKAVSGGCHVTDTSKTSLGYDHAYDWITAIAHTSSCGKTMPYAKRFEVVLAVINGANPPSCPNSRKMPPSGMGTPLTTCQVAALSAWLAEPMVSQMHVPETDDTKDMYPAGPYLMPPFN